MAGRGNTTPKEPANRRRTNSAPDHVTVAADGSVCGPDLPYGVAWADQTRIWWDNWRRSAQAQTFTQTDWDFLLDTAMLHTQYWDGDTTVAAELRLRVSKMGATVGDRQSLRITIDEPDETAGVRQVRARKLKAV
jgi:hypothetical protein